MAQINNNNPIWKWGHPLHPEWTQLGSTQAQDYQSKYNEKVGIHTTIVYGLLRAATHKAGITSETIASGCAETRDGKYISRMQSRSDGNVKKYVLYDPKTGETRGCAYNSITETVQELCLDSEFGKQSSEIYHTDGADIWMAVLPKILSEEEAAMALQNLEDGYLKSKNITFERAAFTFCDNAYQRIIYMNEDKNAGIKLQIPSSGRIPKMSKMDLDQIRIRQVLWGSVAGVGEGSAEPAVEIDPQKYKGIIEKEWSPEEQMLIPRTSKNWIPTKVGKQILDYFYLSKNDPNGRPVRTVLLEGANGAAKTQLCYEDVGAAMGCPVYLFSCSPTTTEIDFKGGFVPRTNGAGQSTKELLKKLPNEIDAQLDPEGSWKRLTGEDKPGATTEQVLVKMNLLMKEHLKKGDGNSNFKFVPSPIVEAFQNGGVLVIDEVTCLNNPGEFRSLNGILNGTTNTFQTPDGPIEVSPDCYIIATGNPRSINNNCGDMDISFRDRFQKVFVFESPSRDRVMDVLLQQGYHVDVQSLEIMVDTYEMVQQSISSHSIKGTVTFRGMIEWLRDVSYGYDLWDAFKINVLNKVSSNQRDRELIMNSINGMF